MTLTTIRTWYSWRLFLFLYLLSESTANYSKNYLKEKYPDYGTKWIYFPNGDEVPTVGYLELPPGDSKISTSISEELENSLNFRLYSRIVKKGVALSFANVSGLKTVFDPKKDTKLITHGWMSSGDSDTCTFIKDAFLMIENVNVVIFDWSEIAGNIFYPVPMARSKSVGRFYGKFLNFLIENGGADPKRMHLVGHSLGAHVSGFAARSVKGKGRKVARITGLDPALPGFSNELEVERLLPTDAEYVDIIHTCAGVLGIEQTVGHADFYPNGGGPPQPGCSGAAELIESCSHGRSWKYFAESIVSKTRFLASKCNSWMDYLQNKCNDRETMVPMGYPAPRTARGSYYLSTQSSPPFAAKVTILSDDDVEFNRLNGQ